MKMFEYLLGVRYEIYAIVSIIMLLSIIVTLYKRSRRNFPPGPWGLPIFGYIPLLPNNPLLQMVKLVKKYGDVFSLRFGSELVVILNDTASIREAFGKPEIFGVPPNSWFSVFGREKAFRQNNWHLWQENSRFLINTLKHPDKLEAIMQDETKQFLEILKSPKGTPINIAALLRASILHNISSFICEKSCNEPVRRILDKNLEEISKMLFTYDPFIFFPWIKHVPFILNLLGFKKNSKVYLASEEIFRKRMEENLRTLNSENKRDVIDYYLVAMEKKQKKNGKTTLDAEGLFAIVTAVFTASGETVKSSIGWTLYTMAAFPEVQKRIQEEIGQVIGMDRNPEFRDMKSMPYSHAVLKEVIRCNTIVPLNALRYTMADSTIAGYDIPAGTIVMANFWAVNHDPRNWEDPDSFKPGRFLTPDEKSVVNSPHFIPFSIGHRSCPGEAIAYMEIFLYVVAILREFDVRFPEGYEPTFEGNLKISYEPPTFKFRFIPKN